MLHHVCDEAYDENVWTNQNSWMWEHKWINELYAEFKQLCLLFGTMLEKICENIAFINGDRVY